MRIGKWHLERAIGVTLFMQSGNRVRFESSTFEIKANGLGQIVDAAWTNAEDGPLSVEWSRVEAVQTTKVWRVRKEQ